MEEGFDFDAFSSHLYERNVDDAKLMIANNTDVSDVHGDGLVWYICAYGPNDPDLLKFCVEEHGSESLRIGTITKFGSPIHQAARWRKPKLVRTLLDFGVPVDHADSRSGTPLRCAMLNYDNESIKILLDAGAQLSHIADDVVPYWVHVFLLHRTNARNTVYSLLCVAKILGGEEKDVMRIIARCVWSTRYEECWE